MPTDTSFKTVSIFAFVGGVDLLFNAVMLALGTTPAAETIQIAIVALTGLVTILMGYFGWRAFVGAVRAAAVLPVSVVGLMLNASNVLLAMRNGLVQTPAIIVALIVVCFSYVCRNAVRNGR